MTYKILSPRITAILCICASELMAAGNEGRDFSPTPQEEQLPTAMHSKMAQLPRVTVSHKDADLVGSDNRVLQAAVDYVAGLGAGTVEIGEGEYVMRDSLHLRPNVTVRNYNGDGISFQQSNDVTVVDCVSEDNAVLGIHPGSGSQRPTVRNCAARRNGGDGLFLCWRVRHGLFEDNLLEENGQFGISIGHKDSDNVLRRNTVRLNKQNGVFFRNEALGMAPHRNRLEDNTIENNGGGWQLCDSDDRVVDFRYGRQGDKWHQDNFIQCIRTREKANADVEQGHHSALLCHMANISYRVGNRKLAFDPKTETFVDAPDANKFLKRTYREPWVVPEEV